MKAGEPAEGISARPRGRRTRQYTAEEAAVEIETRRTARHREQLGVYPVVRRRDVS